MSEKFVIQRPGEEFVKPTSQAHFLIVKIKGRTLSSNDPIIYKKSDMYTPDLQKTIAASCMERSSKHEHVRHGEIALYVSKLLVVFDDGNSGLQNLSHLRASR